MALNEVLFMAQSGNSIYFQKLSCSTFFITSLLWCRNAIHETLSQYLPVHQPCNHYPEPMLKQALCTTNIEAKNTSISIINEFTASSNNNNYSQCITWCGSIEQRISRILMFCNLHLVCGLVHIDIPSDIQKCFQSPPYKNYWNLNKCNDAIMISQLIFVPATIAIGNNIYSQITHFENECPGNLPNRIYLHSNAAFTKTKLKGFLI